MRFLRIGGISLALCLAASAGAVSVTPTSPTDEWTVMNYPTLQPDFSDDQQTGITEADIVGNLVTAAFYMHFDGAGTPSTTDGTLALRVRLGADKNPAGFEHFFGVGLDADLNGSIDLFLAVENSGNPNQLGIFDAGTGLNTSPATTSIISTPLVSYAPTLANYGFQAVDGTIDPGVATTDVDADGNTDFFLTFLIPFQAIVDALGLQGIGFDETSVMQLVIGTSTQPNALNQDLGGPDGGTTSSTSWAALGAMTNPVSPVLLTPEPAPGLLVAFGLLAISAIRRRQLRR